MTEISAVTGLRNTLQNFPTGVTIVTSISKGNPIGGTMNSFTSLSLNPELVLVSIMSGSRTAKAIFEARKFNVNIMAADQKDQAVLFSTGDQEKRFIDGGYKPGINGLPVLDGVIGVIECDLFRTLEIADHTMIVGNVTNSYVLREAPPLIYYRKDFHSATLH